MSDEIDMQALLAEADLYEKEEGGELDEEEQTTLAIMQLLAQRLSEDDCLAEGHRGSLAYRLAEIMVCAKDLYTKALPRLIIDKEERSPLGALGQEASANSSGEAPGTSIFDELAGVRMLFMRLRDLIDDFDDSFMEAMEGQRESDSDDAEWLRPTDWDDEE